MARIADSTKAREVVPAQSAFRILKTFPLFRRRDPCAKLFLCLRWCAMRANRKRIAVAKFITGTALPSDAYCSRRQVKAFDATTL